MRQNETETTVIRQKETMIARFQVLIPFPVYVEANLHRNVNPEEITVGTIKAFIHPPHHSLLRIGDASGESEILPGDVPKRLDPANPQPTAPNVSIGGSPAIVGDVLRIDLQAPEFDRSTEGIESIVNLAFAFANSWLRRFRTLNRIAWAKPLDEHDVPWKIDMLKDDSTALEIEQGKWRTRAGIVSSFKWVGIDSHVWNAITSLPSNYEPQPSDELLLDAYALVPQVGPAIVLAYTAIETRAAQALDRVAVLTGLNPTLWSWLTNRKDFTKDPSPAEQLDVLAKALTGKSLKEDQNLWESFIHLREARNRFVHEGKATLGRPPIQVDGSKATALIKGAEEIIDWLENLLPAEERRPRFQSPNQLLITRPFFVMPGGETPSGAEEPVSE
jgi:hypothetical protein